MFYLRITDRQDSRGPPVWSAAVLLWLLSWHGLLWSPLAAETGEGGQGSVMWCSTLSLLCNELCTFRILLALVTTAATRRLTNARAENSTKAVAEWGFWGTRRNMQMQPLHLCTARSWQETNRTGRVQKQTCLMWAQMLSPNQLCPV